MSKQYDIKPVEQKIERLTKKVDNLRLALNVAYSKLYEAKCASELIELTPQVTQVNDKLEKRKKWGRIPQSLVGIAGIISIPFLSELTTGGIGTIILSLADAAGIVLVEMMLQAVLEHTSAKDNEILIREQELKYRVPDALRKKSPSQLHALEKKYDTEFTRIREQMNAYETTIKNAKTYLKSVDAYEKFLEKTETLENTRYLQLVLRSMEEKLDNSDPMQLNFIEKEALRTHFQNEWNTYITEPITSETVLTHEDLIYKSAQDVYEHPITLHLANKGNQDLK